MQSQAWHSQKDYGERGLYDQRIEHDACGMGFVAQISSQSSHAIVEIALQALGRLSHRGAAAADERSGDGAGLLLQLPRAFFEQELDRAGIKIDGTTPLAVAMLFARSSGFEQILEQALRANGLRLLRWRSVPMTPNALGDFAQSSLPQIVQAIITNASAENFENALFRARSEFERRVAHDQVYVCSMSSQTLVYKALCNARQLADFYPDLRDQRLASAFAIFHQRFATNTQPSWSLAQPFRFLAHNGEINTISGNGLWFKARLRELDLAPGLQCHPNASDSALLDHALEAAIRYGAPCWQALATLVPPAWENDSSLLFELREFYRTRSAFQEPWDGPAALAFADGRFVGAALDRNGLRPCRYLRTRDGLVVAASETGVVDLDVLDIVDTGRLGPGEVLLVDLKQHQLLHDSAFKQKLERETSPTHLAITSVPSLQAAAPIASEHSLTSVALQHLFGYTREDIQFVLSSMSCDGKEPVWSMGDDTPAGSLSAAPRSFYSFFRQRFAQVTNPAIDSLRERCVMSLGTWLGSRRQKANGHFAHLLESATPVLATEQVEWLQEQTQVPVAVVDCTYDPQAQSLQQAIQRVCNEAEAKVRKQTALLILTNRNVGGEAVPLPMALVTGAVHDHLLRVGLRLSTDLIAETGDCFDVHHLAVLIGLGVRAVSPWLALRLAHEHRGPEGRQNLLAAFDTGLLKIMAKMGISTVASYCGCAPFEVLGLSREVTNVCCPRLPNPLSGLSWDALEQTLLGRRDAAFADQHSADLPDHGFHRFRRGGERHSWNPATVRALQAATGSARVSRSSSLLPVVNSSQQWKEFDKLVADHEPIALRDLLGFESSARVPIDEVEPASQIVRRFITSAMSLGSLSPEAHRTLAIAMNRLGARSNTGEGGEDPESYSDPDGERWDNKIKQIASGRFGVTAEYIARAEQLEIKIAQGSKPGEGGQIPAAKVTGLIARLRHATPGIALISPPPHHDIYSIEDLAQLIFDLRRCNPDAAIGVKLAAESGVGIIAAGVVKAHANFVVIAGHSGGTGASPLSSIKHTALPWEMGLAEAQQALVHNQLRSRVRLRVDGGLRSARDVMIAALLGAEEFAFGTAALVALGCDMARQCHLNTCPSGIATQRPELRARFRGRPEHVMAYFLHIAQQIRELLAAFGLHSLDDAVGRVDLLRQQRFDGGLDLRPLLAEPTGWTRRFIQKRPDSTASLDDAVTEAAVQALASGGDFHYRGIITNRDRSVGARIAGEMVRRPPTRDIRPRAVDLTFTGTAGQSFAAFCSKGMRLTLIGEANDYVAKGLCGAEVIVKAPKALTVRNKQPVILGNVALYGATSGVLLAAGAAGERFAIRNSGATAVVEGVGHHACEYMTGGTVVVLGTIGRNFGAGMTGGVAYVLDADQNAFESLNSESVSAVALSPSDRETLLDLLTRHYEATESPRALELLMNFESHAARFWRIEPRVAAEVQIVETPDAPLALSAAR